MAVYGVAGIIKIFFQLMFIWFALWALRPLPLVKIMPRYPRQAQVLLVLLAIVVGYTCSSFFIDLGQTIIGFRP
ncbi:DUF1146 family protein [Furfurilactobacillus siliginis]|uniref:DUF1146 domain-containing protein n=1 Tax=Furfurilactobacillus siliginis TaxID=348151 RepID=A0A0R2LBT7_9LACO|nr:DUF1146 family protein [Furfurilactobacillus siliginis]KRN96716.1 hypothetical protein IV55_GL001250 [Furfurilactobacillus siliginis]GEK28865.1 hypothetical protein LSI01_11760 [Furfurilactobacillus siliginis]